MRRVVRTGRVLHLVLEGEWLTYASAISFQVCHAMIPVVLAALALLGFLNLQEVWSEQLAPRLQRELSEDVFVLVRDTVEDLLQSRRGFWLSFGLGFALWQISGAVRAVMGALNHLYDVDESRSMRARVAVSVALAVAVSLAVMGVVAAAEVLPAILAGAGWGIIPRAAVRWVLPIGALYLVLFLLMRFGPAVERSLNGRSLNTLLVIGGWLVVSAGFRWYVAQVADYTSMFGNLASVFVLMTYVYLSVAVFLLGVKLDALARGAHPKSIEIRNVGT